MHTSASPYSSKQGDEEEEENVTGANFKRDVKAMVKRAEDQKKKAEEAMTGSVKTTTHSDAASDAAKAEARAKTADDSKAATQEAQGMNGPLHHPPPTAHHSPPTAHNPPTTAQHPPPTAHRPPPTTHRPR